MAQGKLIGVNFLTKQSGVIDERFFYASNIKEAEEYFKTTEFISAAIDAFIEKYGIYDAAAFLEFKLQYLQQRKASNEI